MATAYATRMQTIKDARYSFFYSTPFTAWSHTQKAVSPHAPGCTCSNKWFGNAVDFTNCYIWQTQTLQHSFSVVWLYAAVIVVFADLQKNNWRIVRPEKERIDKIARHLYVTHGSIIVSLNGPRYSDPSTGLYKRIAVSLIAIPTVLFGLVVLDVLLVAMWQLARQGFQGLQWPENLAAQNDNHATEYPAYAISCAAIEAEKAAIRAERAAIEAERAAIKAERAAIVADIRRVCEDWDTSGLDDEEVFELYLQGATSAQVDCEPQTE